jgi:site-specific recombinase XerD
MSATPAHALPVPASPPPALSAAAPFPPDRHPMTVYLVRLGPSSQRTMRAALDAAARLLTSGRLGAEQVPWHQLERQHLMALRTRLAETYAPATGNRILTAVRGVLDECWELGYLASEPQRRARTIPPIRGYRLPKGRMLSADELARLFAGCAQDQRPTGRRDAALLALLCGAGLRRSELVHLDVGDYEPVIGALTVRRGKGNKDRRLFAGNGAAEALCEWLTIRGQAPGPMFVAISKCGRLLPRRLSDKAVTWILQERATAAGISNAFSPHDLRRTWISTLLDAGADLATVADLAGHANIATTAKYDRRGEAAKRQAAQLLTVPFVPGPRRDLTAAEDRETY